MLYLGGGREIRINISISRGERRQNWEVALTASWKPLPSKIKYESTSNWRWNEAWRDTYSLFFSGYKSSYKRQRRAGEKIMLARSDGVKDIVINCNHHRRPIRLAAESSGEAWPSVARHKMARKQISRGVSSKWYALPRPEAVPVIVISSRRAF